MARTYTSKSDKNMSRRDITRIVCEFFRLTNEVPKLRHIPHLPFSKQRVIKLFGTWNAMLACADLPLNRYKIREIKCAKCGIVVPRQMKEIRKSKKQFCSSACNASFYTTGRKHSEATKQKISESLKAKRIFKD